MTRYDYEAQAWIVNGIYQDCGHTDEMRDNDGYCCEAHAIAGHIAAH